MPKVRLGMPERSPGPGKIVDFEVAPRIGDGLFLQFGGKSRNYRVADVWHGSMPDGSVGYYAVLEWDEDPPERWLVPDDYEGVEVPPDEE